MEEEEFFFGKIEADESLEKYFKNKILYNNNKFTVIAIERHTRGEDLFKHIITIASYNSSGKLISKTENFSFAKSKLSACFSKIKISGNYITLSQKCKKYAPEHNKKGEIINPSKLQSEENRDFVYYFDKDGMIYK